MGHGVLEALIATDRQFFAAGATNDCIGAATLSWMPGLTHIAAGCVVHSVDVARIGQPHAWLDTIEDAVQGCGASLVRVYLDGCNVPWRGVLEERGYEARTEFGYATTRPLPPPVTRIALDQLTSDDDTGWAVVEHLHRVGGIGSGIYPADGAEWTDLMRRKCASTAMEGYLVTVDGEPCGSVGVLTADGVMRSKNILVDRRFRRRAIGRSTLSLLGEMARVRGCAAIGAFAVDGTDGSVFYPAAGFAKVGAQVEWAREVR